MLSGQYTCNGFYEINNKPFRANKILALIEASRCKVKPQFNYFNDVFKNANKDGLGKVPLATLYTERAKQLRDTYDYLILNYSGGSDSHNILQTFLRNNIKLDCIYVQMPFKYLNSALHIPNSTDLSNANYHSEWDFAIKSDLEYIGKYHPAIKIELGDYTESISPTFYSDTLFETNTLVMPNLSRALKLHTFSKFETDVVSSGKTVGSIYGAEKPHIVIKDNLVFFYLYDRGCMAIPNPENPNGLEYFYWTPDFPEIAVEQAYAVYQWFKKNPSKKYLINAKSLDDYRSLPISGHMAQLHEYFEIVKNVCYPYWDPLRFQTGKPAGQLNLGLGVKPWDGLLIKSEEFSKFTDAWSYYYSSYQGHIEKHFLMAPDETISIKTPWFYLCVE